MTTQEALYQYLLRLGDNALIQGHRLSEWCSKGPILEEDLALTNIALDNIGCAQAFLKYAAQVEGKGKTEDDLAYKRGERQFYNHLITELPIGNFAYTIAKQLMISAYEFFLYTELAKSKDETIAGIAAKTIKEVRYHLAHAQDWTKRLSLGTEVSHSKMQEAFDSIWMYSGELFEMDEVDQNMLSEGIGVDLNAIKPAWEQLMNTILVECELTVPTAPFMQTGSRQGIHTEHLGHLLSEVQYLQRAYPDATW